MKKLLSIFLLVSVFNKCLAQTSWKGTTSTNWSIASNWTNGVPSASTAVIIGDANFTGSFQPKLSATSSFNTLTIGGTIASTLTVPYALTGTSGITINANGTLLHTGAAITLANYWTNHGSYSATLSTTAVKFAGNGVIDGNATSFQNVTINAGCTVNLMTNIAIQTLLSVNGTFIPVEHSVPYVVSGTGGISVNANGFLNINAPLFADNYSLSSSITLIAGSTVEYSATSVNQLIKENLVYSTLRISGAGSTKTPAGNIADLNSSALRGNVYVVSGTLDLSSYNMNRGTTAAGGTFSISNDAALKIGGTNSFPSNYSSVVLGATSIVEYGGGNQIILPKTYGHLTLSSAAGTVVKSMPATAFTVAGNFAMSAVNGSTISFTEAAAVTFKSKINIGNSATLQIGAFATTVSGDITNNGIFNGSASTITISAIGAALKGSGEYNLNNITVSGAGNTIDAATSINVSGNLTTTGSGTLLAASSSTVLMSGAAKKITGTGFTFGNLSITGTVSTINNITVTGNLLINGSFASTATTTLSGAGKAMSGTGPGSFSALYISGNIGSLNNFTVTSSLNVTGTFDATAGTTTFTGSTTISGSPNLYNVVLNGSSCILAPNATLGIAGIYTQTAGILNTTTNIPNTVSYNGTGSQTIAAGTYNNLILKNGNAKTPAGILTINADLTIGAGTTFNSGNFSHKFYGSWINKGTFSASTGTISFLGTANSNVSGITTFYNLIINKSSQSIFAILEDDIAVSNTLSFILGKIRTGLYKVTIPSTGTISGAGQNSGWVNGQLRKYTATGSAVSRTFEIGDGSRFTPATLNFTATITTPGMITASTSLGDHPAILSSGLDNTKSVNRIWTLINSGVAPVAYTATFNFINPSSGPGDLDAGVNTDSLLVRKYSGTWTALTPGVRTSSSSEATGVTGFGDFQLGEIQVCIPPTLNTPTITNAHCNGFSDGEIMLNTAGGTMPFTYLWSNGSTTRDLSGVAAGNYSVVITARGGCSISSGMIPVSQPNVTGAAASGGNQVACSDGDATQTLTASASGGDITWYSAATAGELITSPAQTGVGSVTYYAQNAINGCPASSRTPVTLTINVSPSSPVSGGNQTVCSNGSGLQQLTATATSPDQLIWYNAAAAGTVVLSPVQAGTGTSTYYASAFNGTCYSPSRTPVMLAINPVLATPGVISGPLNVCSYVNNPVPATYSVAAVAGATVYDWTAPSGATIQSGQGTTSVQVTFDNSIAGSHNIFSVRAESPLACTSSARTLDVSKIVPGIPVAISGLVNVCEYIGQPSTVAYSIQPVENATSYDWIVSSGINIVSGQGTTQIQVSFDNAFVLGSVRVSAASNCGSRAPRSLNVSRLLPAVPVAINGPAVACPYIGTGVPVSYSIQPVVNATSYTWTLPANVMLVSGQGTTNISVTFSSGYATSSLKVRSVANCGNSSDRMLSVTASTYRLPGVISGPTNACPFIGAANATYTIRKVTNAASYVWSVPAGAVIISHPGGNAGNDTIITVSYNTDFVSGTKISVQSDGCVPSAARTLTVTRVLPSRPGIITGPGNACPYMAGAENPDGLPAIYSIHKVINAGSYQWTVPAGAVIAGHPAGSGENDTTIAVMYGSGFTGGSIIVAAANGCGPGVERTLSITKLQPGSPGYISVTQLSDCPGRQFNYSISSMPANASSILWTVPPGATIISGQGTESITVVYGSAAVNAVLTATSYNNCSNSVSRPLTVRLNACTASFASKTISEAKSQMLQSLPETLKVSVFPNPSIADFKIRVETPTSEIISIRIVNQEGKEIRSLVTAPFNTVSFGNDFNPGIYFIEVNQAGKRVTQKLIKL